MEIMKINKDKQIKQSNRLIEAKYKLTVYEQRMMIFICSQLNPNAPEFHKVRVSVADMADFCQFDKTKGYSHVKSTIMRLMSRIVQIKMPDGGWYATHWLQKAKYIHSESVVEYEIDDELKPELLQLKSAYLSTPSAPLMEFKRDYAARLYFLLKKMLKVGEFEYDLDFFRDRFQLSKSYEHVGLLKVKVLEPALAEINEKSDIDVVHEYIKQGRVYAKIKFIVKKKDKEDKKLALSAPSEAPEQASEPHTEPIEKELEKRGQTKLFATPSPTSESVEEAKIFSENEVLIAKLSEYRILLERAKQLIADYNAERVEANLKYAIANKHNKKSMAGWIISCIEHDYASAARVTDEIAKKSSKQSKIEQDQKLREKLDLKFGLDDYESSKLISEWGHDRVSRNADYILSNCNYKQKEERKAQLATAVKADLACGSNGSNGAKKQKVKRKRGDYSPYHYSAKEYQHIYV